MNAAELEKKLAETKPSWEQDGLGVRGLQPSLPENTPARAPVPKADFVFKEYESRSSLGELEPDPVVSIAQEGAAGATCIGLSLYTKSTGGSNSQSQVWISAGTVGGELPSDFDESDGKNIANGGSGNVWAEVNIDQEDGSIVSVAVAGGASTPNNTNTSFYYTLGFYEYDGNTPTVTNYGCGSVEVTICRNWFAAESPFYGVRLSRCGCGGGY
jgi:hypothetical protein